MRGLTTHCRRDPKNAKRVGRTVRDLFCTGAQEVGNKVSGVATRWVLPLRAGRLCDLLCSNPAQRPRHKNHTQSGQTVDG